MPTVPQDEFLKRVLEAVDARPATVSDIARRAGVSWQAAKRALETLEKLGAIRSKNVGKRLVYYKIERPDDTWFRIPIDGEQRRILEYIYLRASEEYKKITGKDLGKTQAQKIAVKVIQAAGLNIPTPRYLYGRVTLLTFEHVPKRVNLSPQIARRLDKHIRDAVIWAVGKEGRRIAEAQYEEENNKLHRTLMKIEEALSAVVRGQKPPESVVDLLMDLLAYVPDEEGIVEIVKELISHRWLLNEGIEGILKFKELFGVARSVIAKQLMYEDLRAAGFTDEVLENLISAKHFSLLEFWYLLNEIDEKMASERTRTALQKIRNVVDDQETRMWKEKGSKVLRELGFD